MNANSGYVGWSRSVRATEAEAEGKLPLTRAIPAVSSIAGCTRNEARAALVAMGPCEWHHTSKKFNRTDFYNVGAACLKIAIDQHIAAMPGDWRERMAAVGNGNLTRDVFAKAAEPHGVNPDALLEAYYGTIDTMWEDMNHAGDFEPTVEGMAKYLADDE